jgi:hypothetical protein
MHSINDLRRPIRVEPFVWRVGLPDTWMKIDRPGYLLEQESRRNAHITQVVPLHWSFGILVISVCGLSGAVFLGRRVYPRRYALRVAVLLLCVVVVAVLPMVWAVAVF